MTHKSFYGNFFASNRLLVLSECRKHVLMLVNGSLSE